MEYLEAKCAKIKKLCAKNVKIANSLLANTATLNNLQSDSATIKNLNVSTINGSSLDSFTESAKVLPVIYQNGLPQQPQTPTINQDLANVLWGFALIEQLFVTSNAASGRMRNHILNQFYGCSICPSVNTSDCDCPIPGYAVFQGSINGKILTVTNMEIVSLTDCPPVAGTIQIGQRLFTPNNFLLESTIISQETGIPGGIGTYTIQNSYDDYSKSYTGQLLSLSNLTQNDCIKTPLRIYGSEITSLTQPQAELNNLNLMSNISYNLNIVNRSLSTKVAIVYVQIGWINGLGEVEIRGIEVDTRQFDPSVLSYGELMNNTVFLPTELVESVAAFNLFGSVANAAIQLIVYVEEGLEVLQPITGPFGSRVSREISRDVPTATNRQQLQATYTTSFVSGSYTIQTYDVPSGSTKCRIQAGAGGGGGASVGGPKEYIIYDGSGGAGGGGSGQEIDQEFSLNGVTQIKVSIGAGGPSDVNGFPTMIAFQSGEFASSVVSLYPGNAGGGPSVFAGGNGGSGYYGGGGGSYYTGLIFNGGDGGAGLVGTPGANGITGGGSGGDGGAPVGKSGGQGAKNPDLNPGLSLGGGGGGVGGGSGQFPGNTNGSQNATGRCAGGGGGSLGGGDIKPESRGGRGGAGYFQVTFL